jgi:hypothetical protein
MAPLFAKIFEKMLDNWGRQIVEQHTLEIADEQGGFMPKRSTHDSIFLLLSLRDAQIRRGRKMYGCFLDIRKAFDSVDHKIFLMHMRHKRAPEDWIRALARMLETRQLKLFDALIQLQVGTVQGSPVSPLLFILFINPMIERLKALGRGINLLSDHHAAEHLISCLLFADDTCLVAENLSDLRAMIEVCRVWAADFGMKFNGSKSELIQLAGKIPRSRVPVKIDGDRIPWVKEVKYLGVLIQQGRRKRHPAPLAKMWKSYHRIKEALSSRLPIPLKSQLLLLKTDLLAIALYPSAVVQMDYNTIDRFINRALYRITGCQLRYTSATFLRSELGFPSSRFLADFRSLSYYHHLTQETWFRHLLPNFQGVYPLERIKDMAKVYKVDLSSAKEMGRDAWKEYVKRQIMLAAEASINQDLLERGYPWRAEAKMAMRPYIRDGGYHARSGLAFRWEAIRSCDERFVRTERDLEVICEGCERRHKRHSSSVDDIFSRCEVLVPARHAADLDRAIKAVLKDISGVSSVSRGAIPVPFMLRLRDAFESFAWANQKKETLHLVLDVLGRISKNQERMYNRL